MMMIKRDEGKEEKNKTECPKHLQTPLQPSTWHRLWPIQLNKSQKKEKDGMTGTLHQKVMFQQ